MSTPHLEALLAAVIGTGFVWMAVVDRRRGSRNWWAYLVGSALVYVDAIRAAAGVTLSGW